MKIALDDISANVEVHGEGRPVVLLHGSFCNTLLWQPQIEGLADTLTLIAVDIRGHGGTPCPVTARSFDRSLDVIQALDHLGIKKAFFCGLSMGGPIAVQLALDYPDRCLGLILLATGIGPGDRPLTATQEMKDNAEREASRLLELGTVEYFFSLQTAQMLGVKEFLEEPEQRTFFEAVLVANNTQWLADSLRLGGIDVPPEMQRLLTSSRMKRLHELTKPLLFMVGSLDEMFLPVADFLTGNLRNCEVHVVPGATHLINVDSAQTVNSRIRAFVERVPAC